jgi:alkylated DNA repair protein (DNA oxidative demethylase)
MRGVVEQPAGLRYEPDLLTADQERDLLTAVTAYDFEQVVMHGQAAKRTVCHFGVGYEYDSARTASGRPLPTELVGLRTACAVLADVDPERLVEALVTRYPPGASIGWHRDAPVFGATVVGVSLLSACTMRFQRRTGGERRVFSFRCTRGPDMCSAGRRAGSGSTASRRSRNCGTRSRSAASAAITHQDNHPDMVAGDSSRSTPSGRGCRRSCALQSRLGQRAAGACHRPWCCRGRIEPDRPTVAVSGGCITGSWVCVAHPGRHAAREALGGSFCGDVQQRGSRPTAGAGPPTGGPARRGGAGGLPGGCRCGAPVLSHRDGLRPGRDVAPAGGGQHLADPPVPARPGAALDTGRAAGGEIAEETLGGPRGVAVRDGGLFVSDKGGYTSRIVGYDLATGERTVIVDGLPDGGWHEPGGPVFGDDGLMCSGRGRCRRTVWCCRRASPWTWPSTRTPRTYRVRMWC